MSENFFYRNRNEPKSQLHFKKWLPSVYLSSVKILRTASFAAAEARYRRELQAAIIECGRTNNKSKLESILSKFNTKKCQKFYKEVLEKEKRKRQTAEQERNVNIIQENIKFILNKCRNKIQSSYSTTTVNAYTEIVQHLERLELSSINAENPIASGVIDLSDSGDLFTDLLSLETKQTLTNHTFHDDIFPEQINMMINDFENIYKDLPPNFDPSLMRPIVFPTEEIPIETRRTLMTTFDLLEGLRYIWSCRPALTEDEYSENAYVIHAVSRVLNPILAYSKWPLKRAWSEQTSKSSQSRMVRMEATNSGKKPDLQVLLNLDTLESELILAEISRLSPQNDKEIIDRVKLIRTCKDCFDERYNLFFNGKDDTSETAISIGAELGKIPILGIQVIRTSRKRNIRP
ncbi:hypothetical protein RhiirA4_478737 [Rhizophagus irregularis]|uniref:Uncharacterized protein n=1 Tax=Rhizophagus irregularis TaxID=588596 RepID=A0A2I1HFD4_9GLOM|nr:hypothetical protein RhiirA4_478737 [Rhizophagus irregularis]